MVDLVCVWCVCMHVWCVYVGCVCGGFVSVSVVLEEAETRPRRRKHSSPTVQVLVDLKLGL